MAHRRFDDRIIQPFVAGHIEEIADKFCLIDLRWLRALDPLAFARPADFTDIDMLVRKRRRQLAITVHQIGQSAIFGDAFPIGQHVNGDEIDAVRQLRIFQPDMPRFGCGDGNVDLPFRAFDVGDQLYRALYHSRSNASLPTIRRLTFGLAARRRLRAPLFFVLGVVRRYPGAEIDVDAMPPCNRGIGRARR